jgi:hypothetical protein
MVPFSGNNQKSGKIAFLVADGPRPGDNDRYFFPL